MSTLLCTAAPARPAPRWRRLCHASREAVPVASRRQGKTKTIHRVEQPDDRLYREKGYGLGDAPLVLGGQGGLGLLGTCAGLQNPAPPCGTSPSGVYGNGLVYGFGRP